jgi:hypothetical protein
MPRFELTPSRIRDERGIFAEPTHTINSYTLKSFPLMPLELSGRLVTVLPEQTGNGRNGVWKKQDFVIELAGPYPKKCA